MKNLTRNLSPRKVILVVIIFLPFSTFFMIPNPFVGFITNHFERHPINFDWEGFSINPESPELAGGFTKLLPELHDLLNEGGTITTAHHDEWTGFQTLITQQQKELQNHSLITERSGSYNPVMLRMNLDEYERYKDIENNDFAAWQSIFEKMQEDIDYEVSQLQEVVMIPRILELKVQSAQQGVALFMEKHIGIDIEEIPGIRDALPDLSASIMAYGLALELQKNKGDVKFGEN